MHFAPLRVDLMMAPQHQTIHVGEAGKVSRHRAVHFGRRNFNAVFGALLED